ncbi:NAD-dependent epimerase/dehydratase family protein [Chloroflexota bacterium]
MKILVTGSEGSLMQHVIPLLIKEQHEVVGVDNCSRYGLVNRKRDYIFIKCDLTNPKVVKEVCKGVDVIIQAAAQIYGIKGFHKFPADILSKDVVLHQNLLWEGLKSNIYRMVYISSSMVYERATKVPSSEEDINEMRVPLTDYGLSKLVGERLCKAFQHQYGLDYTIWRPFNIITPYENAGEEEGMSHVFADFINKIVIEKQNPVEILGDGEQIRCFIWIDDVATAIAKYSFLDITKGESFNLGNPEPVTMKELAQNIFNKIKLRGVISSKVKLKFIYKSIYNDDVRIRIPSIEKAQRILSWNPMVTLDDALDRCIDEALVRR